jgi:HD-like signal output (HDOD) protein
MVSLVLMSENSREEQILKMALEQQGIKVLISKPSFQNQVVILQFAPDLILIEIPRSPTFQLDFTIRIRKHRQTRSIPIIGYGNKLASMMHNGIIKQGISLYIERPLKFTLLIMLFERFLKPLNKKIDTSSHVADKNSDMDLILNPEIPGTQKIEAMTRHISTLFAFPFTVAKVLQITQDDKSGAGHLAHAIVADPSMTTHLLKVANSVFFASSNRKLNSIQDSIVRIGFLETKKIIMSMTVMKLFDTKNSNLGFDRIDFWYHSLAVGLISEKIARYMGDINVEEAFLAGLMHDLGIILLDDFFPSVFSKVLESTAKDCAHFTQTMKSSLLITHNDLIAVLFPTWKVPQNITDAITQQDNIEQFENNVDTPGKKITLCVAIANIVAKLLHIGRGCDEFIKPIPDWVFRQARLPYGIQSEFVNQIFQNVEIFRNFLGLEKREYSSPTSIDCPETIRIAVAKLADMLFIPPLLYLTNNHISFEMINIETPISTYDARFNLILAIVGESTSVEKVNPLGKILKSQESGGSSISQLQYVPVLVIGPENYQFENLSQNFSYIKNQFDIRLFDLKLEELVSQPNESIIQSKKA